MKKTKFVVWLTGFVLVTLVAALTHISYLQSGLINSAAIRSAELYATSLTEFRTLYTSEVVTRATSSGMEITHDYESSINALPLPATLTIKLGKSIGAHSSGANAYLYSPYPFPWRAGEARSELQDTIWQKISNNPNQPFSQFTESDSGTSLFYGVADIMRPSCIGCHNSHPESPKTDWKVGDVRGVLLVELPLESFISATGQDLRVALIGYMILGVAGLIVAFIVYKMYLQSEELEYKFESTTLQYDELSTIHKLATDVADVGIFAFDIVQNHVTWDRTMSKLYGLATGDFDGQHETWISMLDPEHREKLTNDWLESENATVLFITEFSIETPTGEKRWIKHHSRLVLDEAGVATRIIGTNWDITGSKADEKLKNEFVATVSHELRTPLTAIIGSLALLRAGVVSEPSQSEKLIEMSHRNCERLVRLTNDILDMEKVQSGNLKIDMKPHDLCPLIQNSIEINAGMAKEKQITLLLNLQDNLYAVIDNDRFAQVMDNLISNAIKFSHHGAEVLISAHSNEHVLRVSVTDHGIGIEEKDFHLIFNRFIQVDSDNKRKNGSTGLGLAICKHIVHEMQGRIDFESVLGRGSVFYFELPEYRQS